MKILYSRERAEKLMEYQQELLEEQKKLFHEIRIIAIGPIIITALFIIYFLYSGISATLLTPYISPLPFGEKFLIVFVVILFMDFGLGSLLTDRYRTELLIIKMELDAIKLYKDFLLKYHSVTSSPIANIVVRYCGSGDEDCKNWLVSAVIEDEDGVALKDIGFVACQRHDLPDFGAPILDVEAEKFIIPQECKNNIFTLNEEHYELAFIGGLQPYGLEKCEKCPYCSTRPAPT